MLLDLYAVANKTPAELEQLWKNPSVTKYPNIAKEAPNNLEPITQETADRMENGPEVTVTSCKSQGDGGKSGP